MARAPDLRRCRCNVRLRFLRYLRFAFLASMRYPTRHGPCGKRLRRNSALRAVHRKITAGCGDSCHSLSNAISASIGRDQISAIVRSSVANSVTLPSHEDHDGNSASVPRLLRQQEAAGRGNAGSHGIIPEGVSFRVTPPGGAAAPAYVSAFICVSTSWCSSKRGTGTEGPSPSSGASNVTLSATDDQTIALPAPDPRRSYRAALRFNRSDRAAAP